MKKVILKGVAILLVSFYFASSASANASIERPEMFQSPNDETGEFKLVIKNVPSSLENTKNLRAYVTISNQHTGEVVLSTVVNVKYENGHLLSSTLVLPLGAYRLEQIVLFPSTNSLESIPAIRVQLPLTFSVTEK